MKIKIFKIVAILLALATGLSAQVNQTITGYISDKEGVVPFANVSVKGTTRGAIADEQGRYTIDAAPGSTLVFSFIGYEAREYTVQDEKTIDIVLLVSSVDLDEVIFIGYGSMKKSDLTGSVASVDVDELVAASVSSLDQGIQGRVSGVYVKQLSGQPGSGTSIRIRGTTSITGTNEPLYVIDGMPLMNDDITTGITHHVNPLSSINPSDIESLEILKDASATAIYGAQGANGVVLITTKKGSLGPAQISFGSYFGLQTLAKKLPMLTARELAELGNEATDNAGLPRKDIFASPVNLGTGTDWQDEIYRPAAVMNYQLNFMGGNEKSNYNISLNYFDQEGIIINSDFRRISFRTNLESQVKDYLKVGTQLSYSNLTSNGVVTDGGGTYSNSISAWALEFNPGLAPWDEDGNYVYENNLGQPATPNPVAEATESDMLNTQNRLIGNLFAELDIWSHLKFRTSIGLDRIFVKDQTFSPNFLSSAEHGPGTGNVVNSENMKITFDNLFSYDNSFGKSSVNAVLGQSLQTFDQDMLALGVQNFEDNRLGYNSLQLGKNKWMTDTRNVQWRMLSFLARVNYVFDNTYYVTASGRVDGSSKFGENNKYGFFPSLAIAWRLSQEEFLQNAEQLSNLKLRVGYGVVGNEGIPPYSSQGLLFHTETYYGDNSEMELGQAPGSLPNDDLRWEKTSQIGAGVDAGFFNNRISLTLDFYYKKTSDLLLNVPIPYSSGYETAMMNVGDMQNVGYEIFLNATPVRGAVEWNTKVSFSANRNEILSLNNAEGRLYGDLGGISDWTRIVEGQSVGTFYGYRTNGIVQLDEDLDNIPHTPEREITYGEQKYVDKNGDDVIDRDNDTYILGDANPDFIYSWMNTLTYKGWDFSIYIQGVYGNEIANFSRVLLESFNGLTNNTTAALERWTPDVPSNEYPRADANPPSPVMSDRWVEDGSYLRLQDISIGYNFNLKSKKEGIKSLRIYVSGKNLYTLTNYSGYSPEVNRYGKDPLRIGAEFGTYPMARTFLIGLNLNF